MNAFIPQFPVAVSLRRLFPLASFVGCADIYVTNATERSRECEQNTLFAAIPGTRVDGTEFVGEAISRGATALLVRRPLPDVGLSQCVVPDVRRAFAELCDALAGNPSFRLKVTGVTGTNGKTTVTWLIRSILQAAGKRTGILGTVEYSDGEHQQPARLTTPDSHSMSRWLKSMVQQKTTHAAIELSSHALDQGRASGLSLCAAVVTNVTQDHFDYHTDFPSYLDAKARILSYCRPNGIVLLNADDPGSAEMRRRYRGPAQVLSYGLEQPADFSATILEETRTGSRFVVTVGDEHLPVSTALVGRHNVSNCLAAAAVCRHFGVEPEGISRGIERLAAVPGRLERIDCGQPFDIFVDYAHTEDALSRCVKQLGQFAEGRVICVFGAGGDRDRSKRHRLGHAATQADLAVVTSDNPRTEHPDRIIDDILGGIVAGTCELHVEADRSTAIGWALDRALPGDCVLVAGKGHEDTQIVGTQRFPFDDRQIIRQFIQSTIPLSVPRPQRLRA